VPGRDAQHLRGGVHEIVGEGRGAVERANRKTRDDDRQHGCPDAKGCGGSAPLCRLRRAAVSRAQARSCPP
jgi:hypothetical protein